MAGTDFDSFLESLACDEPIVSDDVDGYPTKETDLWGDHLNLDANLMQSNQE